MPSQTGRPQQRLAAGNTRAGLHGFKLQSGIGQRTGLVKNNGVNIAKRLNGLQAPHQYTVTGQQASSGQHSRGRGQRKRTGASHYQHGNSGHQRHSRVSLPPKCGCTQRCQQHKHQERLGYLVSQHRQTRLVCRRLLHQRNDLGVTRLKAEFVNANERCIAHVVAACQHRLAYAPRNWP